ncbi:MAG: SpoIIE family protein phosphatase [Deltaproteobacteria bacterium]
MIKVLCVDDNKHITDIVSHYLTQWGYQVLVASDGETGWSMIQEERPEIVLTDWLMPGMDGLELCRRVRSSEFSGYTYLILLTAKDEKKDLILGMEAGADDFISKPVDFRELKVRLHAAARVVTIEQQLIKANRELDEKNLKLNEMYGSIKMDLEAAAQIQRTMLPDKSITLPGFNFDWLFTPSMFIAGDIFNIFQIDTNHLNFYLIDVSGHGIPAALLSTTLSRVLSPYSHLQLYGTSEQIRHDSSERRKNPMISLNSPANVALALNKRFMSYEENIQYFTMVYGSIDLQNGSVTVTQAGHPPPIYQSSDGAVRIIEGGGFPIGLVPDASFVDVSFSFEPSGRLFLYSDGITECRGKNDRIANTRAFGDDALQEVICSGRNLPLDELMNRLRCAIAEHRGSDFFDDDISLLAIERRPL